MPKFTSRADFQKIPAKSFVVESSPTPPVADADALVGFLWNDTSIASNSVMKYWDGDEWVRMDGGGDIPNGMVVNRHVAADAAIEWSKIAHPTNLATTDDVDRIDDDITGLVNNVNTLIGTDTGQSVRQIAEDAIADAGLAGSFVTLDTTQTVTGAKTFTESPIVPAGDAPTEAVNFGQLENLRTTLGDRVTATETKNTAQDARLQALEDQADQVNAETQDALDDLAARVTTAEGEIDTLQGETVSLDNRLDVVEGTGAGSITAAVNAERDRALAAEGALDDRIDAEEDAREAGDTASLDAVATERTRATGVEADLDGRLDTAETALGTVDARIQDAIDDEADRVDTALALKADLVGGIVPLEQLPRIAVTSTRVVANAAARDALEVGDGAGQVQEGDVVIVTGLGSYILNADGDWIELAAPAGGATAADLAAERQARIDADTALGARIDTEHTHHTTAEATLQTNIDAERTRAVAAETANAAAVADEATRATAAETALGGRITTEVTDRTAADASIRDDFAAADTALQDALSDEVTRATAAEATLQTNIGNEATARQQADNDLSGRINTAEGLITAETTRATAAETDLQAQIDALEDEFGTSNTDLTALTTRVTNAEGRLTTAEGDIAALEAALATETAAREAGDTALQGQLTTLQGDASTVGSVANAVAQEATARASADTALQNSLNAEINNRTTADTALGDRISTEEAARIAGDNAINTSITNLGSTLRGEFEAADEALRDDVEAADQALQADIDTRAVDADVVHKAGAEAITGVKTFSVSPLVPAGTTGLEAVNYTQLEALRTQVANDMAPELEDLGDRVDALEAHDTAETTRVDNALALKADLVNGKVPITQLPSFSLTDVSYAADIAARDALADPAEGDVAIVGDNGSGVRQSFVYDGTQWVALSSPADVTEAELAAAVDNALDTLTSRIDALEAGAGLTRTGDRFDIVALDNSIEVAADGIRVADTYAGGANITTVGTVANGTWEGDIVGLEFGGTGYAATDLADLVQHLGINIAAPTLFAKTLTGMVEGTPMTVVHNMGGRDLVPSVRSVTTGEVVIADVFVVDENTVTVLVDASYTNGDDLRITLVGGPVETSGANAGRIAGRIAGRRD